MDVSIIIVNYNTLELTKDTIDSVIEKTEGIDYEIILVDNDSQDGSKEYFEKNYSDKIKFIKSEKNLGFGKANNLGMDVASGKYMFLLNSDTLLVNNAVKILYDFMEENLDVGISGGNLYSKDMSPVHSFSLKLISVETEIQDSFNYFEKINRKILGKNRRDFNFTDKPVEVGYITGADMMIRKEALEKAGKFDPDFFMYYEETELTARIKRAGYKVMAVPTAKIIHLEGQSFSFKETRTRMMLESKYKYFDKVFGKKDMGKSYYISQAGWLIKFILTLKSDYKKTLDINREEYTKQRVW